MSILCIRALAFRFSASAAVFLAGLAPTCVHAQQGSADPDSIVVLQEIKVQTMRQTQAYMYVKELSDAIGPRLTGSAQASKACQWAMQKMKRSGLQNVHLEPFPIGRGWERGHAHAELSLPFRLGLNVASYGWVGSTMPGGTEADVVAVNSDFIPDEIKQHAATWNGKVLFLVPLGPKHVNPIRSYSQMGPLLAAAAKAHAVAVISSTGRPGEMLNHTGPAAFADSSFSIPVVDIAPNHQQLLARLLASRARVRMKIDVQNSFVPGPILANNVVGEIPGSEHPSEIVILGAHLDSWDLGTGSIDDGFGVAAVLGAADAILAQHIRPRRTVRIVLFTGEEQGLLGSLAYVRAHRAELKNILGAFVLDWGSGPISKLPLAGHTDLEPAFSHFAQLAADVATIQVDHSYLVFSDAYAFTLAGIPGITPFQESPNYVQVGHSGEDLLDKVDKKNLIEDTAVLAAVGFWLANYPSRLGVQWSHSQTVKALTRDNQKAVLELFGLWNLIR